MGCELSARQKGGDAMARNKTAANTARPKRCRFIDCTVASRQREVVGYVQAKPASRLKMRIDCSDCSSPALSEPAKDHVNGKNEQK
jgi:hypothetical protein